MRTHIWVVEIMDYMKDNPQWEPTVGVALSREDARAERARWQANNPDDKFRIRPYLQLSHE